MKSLGMPPRSLTKTTLWPVLGFHAGEVLAPFANVSRLGVLPFASVTKSSGLPSIDDEKMRREPSGDQAGELLVPRKRGKVRTFPASIEYMHICGLTMPREGAKHVKPIREPSRNHPRASEITS